MCEWTRRRVCKTQMTRLCEELEIAKILLNEYLTSQVDNIRPHCGSDLPTDGPIRPHAISDLPEFLAIFVRIAIVHRPFFRGQSVRITIVPQ